MNTDNGQQITRLYVIGNGFDIHHGINSSYSDFYNWMIENYPDVINNVDEIYGCCDGEWWGNFEDQLGSLDAVMYGENIAFQNKPDLGSDHCDRMWNDAEYEVEQNLQGLYNDIRNSFHNWILQLKKPLPSQKIILETQSSLYLNFNYTETLEDLYGIYNSSILHIHGCINRDEEFILGHGKSYEELQKSNVQECNEPSADLSAEELQQYYEHYDDGHMLHEQLAVEAAIGGVASQRKPVEELMQKYGSFFKQLHNIENVFVYGLSLSSVDIPYLQHISDIARNAKWHFSDYQDNNRSKIIRFCEQNGIINPHIIELEELKCNRCIQLELNFEE